jgi:glycosyltransferase involved in cell wall biosynthesis
MSAAANDTLRILMLNYEYPPVGGGAANATRYILREMVRSGQVQVDLVTSSAGRADSITEPEPGLRIHYLNVRKRSMHYWTHREIVTYLVRGRTYASRLMATGEFDCCHAMLGFPAGLIAKLICRGRRPYIVSLRGSDVPGFNRRFALHYHALRPVFRRIWRSAAATVANSAGLRDLAIETDPTVAIDVIPNGIDLDEFSPADPAPTGPFRLVCVSRLISRKAIDVLITAFAIVYSRFPDAELVIVGDGVLDSQLRDLAARFGLAGAIRFEGCQPHEKIAGFYRSAHMFVLPSRHEGMSNAMLEAMACGLPVVVTNTGGTAELVKDNGIIVPTDDPGQLATAMLTLLDDENRRRDAGRASRTIARKFGWQSCAHQYIETYREAVDRAAENERAVAATST